jgi:hypothetical protein
VSGLHLGNKSDPKLSTVFFGLVDANGVPTDGALAALSEAYHAEEGLLAGTSNGP